MIPINTLLTTSSVVMRTFLPFAPGLYRRPLSTNLPEVSEFEKNDWLAVPTLTELSLCCNGQSMVLRECICLVTMEKNIVQTALQGRNGTIKEYINDGDFQVEIAAALTSECDDYPKDELKKLMDIIQMNDMIEVASDFLDLFNIRNLVVKSYGFNQETHSNRQTFTVCCLSDTPYEIKLQQG
ncbi:MAG: hypothetical protein E6Q66_05835 [Pedobacter sp.]|nr:MAG: hypothetical protein E6Q66_05835 [Pedobacter sp.]